MESPIQLTQSDISNIWLSLGFLLDNYDEEVFGEEEVQNLQSTYTKVDEQFELIRRGV